MNSIMVSYGYANEPDPKGSFEGLGTGNKYSNIIFGKFMDFVRLGGETYLIASDEKEKMAEDDIGRVDVRRALLDVYGDGADVVFLDQEKSGICDQIERFLNSEEAKDRLKEGISVLDVCHGANSSFMPASKLYSICKDDDEILATSIKHDAFEEKKETMDSVKGSIISMQEEIRSLQEQLHEMNSNYNR